jgi:hypothetical protein
MSANPAARNRRRSGVCGGRSMKSDEGSREDTDEASNEGSNDVLRIRVSFGHAASIPRWIPPSWGSVYKRA